MTHKYSFLTISVNRSVTLQNVLIERNTGTAKLSNFGFFYLTMGGKAVDFFVGDMALSAPEVIAFALMLATMIQIMLQFLIYCLILVNNASKERKVCVL